MTLYDTLWHSMTLYDTLWHSMTLYYRLAKMHRMERDLQLEKNRVYWWAALFRVFFADFPTGPCFFAIFLDLARSDIRNRTSETSNLTKADVWDVRWRAAESGPEHPRRCTPSCRSLSAKEPLIIELLRRKWPKKIRHTMRLGHPVVSICPG